MAKQQLLPQDRKSIVAAALISLGLLILFRNAAEAASFVRFLGMVGHEADSLGILTASTMTIRRIVQAYLFNHTQFVGVVYQVLISFLALLLVVTGTLFV